MASFDTYFDSVLERLDHPCRKREFIERKKAFLLEKRSELEAIFKQHFDGKDHLFIINEHEELDDDQEMEMMNLQKDFWFAMVGACDVENGPDIYAKYKRITTELASDHLERAQIKKLEKSLDKLLDCLEMEYSYYEPFPDE